MSTTKRSMQKASEHEAKSEVRKVNMKEKPERFALVPENLHQAVIQTLGQLPVEPFGQRALLMLRDLRQCNYVEQQKDEKEAKND